ncbi:MAG: extracellular solute-binding protein [Anaerolineae bacterium]|nr:extracellular solute-binding protein [Anaerolineae bacterium]
MLKQQLSRRDFLRTAALAGAGLAMTLAGCQKITPTDEASETTSSAPAEVSGDLRVLILQGAPVEPVNEFLATATTAKYPKVDVNFEYISGDHAEGVYTQAAAGTLADVIFSADLWVVPFAMNDVTLDMKPLAEADPDMDLDDIFPSMLGLGVFEGEVHMFPSSLDVVTMYYNKTLFEQVGGVPTEDWTWDDFIDACKKITELEKDAQGNPMYWGISNATWNWWATVYPWIVGYGGDIKNEDGSKSTWSDAKALEGLKAYTQLWTEHNIAQPISLDLGGNAFHLSRAATWFHIPGQRTANRENIGDKFEWDAQVMPKMPDGKHRTGMGAWGLSVFAGSKLQEIAYYYVKTMVSPQIQELLAKKEQGVPLVRSVAEKGEWMENLPTPPENVMAFVKGADDAVLPTKGRDYPGECGSFYAGLVNQSYVTALESVIRGEAEVEQAFIEADQAIQICLDENL